MQNWGKKIMEFGLHLKENMPFSRSYILHKEGKARTSTIHLLSQKEILLFRRRTFIIDNNFFISQFVSQRKTLLITLYLYSHRRISKKENFPAAFKSFLVNDNFNRAQFVCKKKPPTFTLGVPANFS